MNWKRLLILSLVINGLLAVLFFRWQPDGDGETPERTKSWPDSRSGRSLLTRRSNSPRPIPSYTIEQLGEFLEKQAVLSSLARHLLLAELQRRHRETASRLLTLTNPWLTGSELYALQSDRMKQFLEFTQKSRNEAESLFRPEELMSDTSWTPKQMALQHQTLGGLGSDRTARVLQVFSDAAIDAKIRDKIHPGIVTESDLSEKKRSFADLCRKLDGLLSPAEKERVDAEVYSGVLFDVWGMKRRFGCEMTAEETEGFVKILMPDHVLERAALDEKLKAYSPFDPIPRDKAARIRSLVGEDKFGSMLRQSDRAFGTFHDSDPSGRPSPIQFVQAYDARCSFEDAEQDLSRRRFENPEEFATAREKLRRDTAARFVQIFGINAVERMKKEEGHWIRSFAQP